MSSKKAQAAMEFLTTYGWALLVVLVAISALTYYGVLSNNYMPNKVDFGPGVFVVDYQTTSFDDLMQFRVFLKNDLGKNMEDTRLIIPNCSNSTRIHIPSGEIMEFNFACNTFPIAEQIVPIHLEYGIRTETELLNHSRKAKLKITPQVAYQFGDTNAQRKAWALFQGASGDNDANRFVPCNATGCTNTDVTLLQAYGGYVDSMTGKVWSNEVGTGQWSIQVNAWDTVQPQWNHDTSTYVVPQNVNLAQRDDGLTEAFLSCTNATIGGKSDWKLPSETDYDFLHCDKCLPPSESYPPSGSTMGKYYWTETIAAQVGFARCIPFVEDSPLGDAADCNKDQIRPIRCIRDNP